MPQFKKYKSNAYNNSLALIVTDLFSIGISFGLAILIRTVTAPWFNAKLEAFSGYFGLILLNIFIILSIFALMGLYRGFGEVAVIELRNITKSIFIAYVIQAFSAYLIGQGNHLSRTIFILSMLFCLLFVPMLRLVTYNRFSRGKNWGVSVVVIGSAAEFPDITKRLQNIHRLGFKPVAILCTDYTPDLEKQKNKIPIYKFSKENCEKLRENGIRYAFYSSAPISADDLVLMEISKIFSTIYFILPESGLSSLWSETTDLLGRPALKVHYQLLEKRPLFIKRCFEVAISAFVLLITLPLSLIALISILLEGQGQVFYRQKRYGLNG